MAVSYLIKGRRAPGDTIPVKLIRGHAASSVQLRLCYRGDRDALIPENVL